MAQVYIAGKFEEAPQIAAYAKRLESAGHFITVKRFKEQNVSLESQAIGDLAGVILADTCIFILEKPLAYSGTMTELGIAVARGKKVIVVGHGADGKNVFLHLPPQCITRVETFEDALSLLGQGEGKAA